jgi:transcriptional regulator with XRE-family HTH domain
VQGQSKEVFALPVKHFSPERLKELRERAGVSRTAIAYAVARSERSVWLWERGKVKPSADVLARVADSAVHDRRPLGGGRCVGLAGFLSDQ